MPAIWASIASRMIAGLNVQPGELIQVRDHAGRMDVLLEVLLAVEQAGATPLPELTPPDYLDRLWSSSPLQYLQNWDQHRGRWMNEIDRALVLASHVSSRGIDQGRGFGAWEQAIIRLTEAEERRRLPVLVVGIPTERAATGLDLSLQALEARLLHPCDQSWT